MAGAVTKIFRALSLLLGNLEKNCMKLLSVQAVESGIMTEIHFSDVSSVAHTDILSS
jgi:hypothetical protein